MTAFAILNKFSSNDWTVDLNIFYLITFSAFLIAISQLTFSLKDICACCSLACKRLIWEVSSSIDDSSVWFFTWNKNHNLRHLR